MILGKGLFQIALALSTFVASSNCWVENNRLLRRFANILEDDFGLQVRDNDFELADERLIMIREAMDQLDFATELQNSRRRILARAAPPTKDTKAAVKDNNTPIKDQKIPTESHSTPSKDQSDLVKHQNTPVKDQDIHPSDQSVAVKYKDVSFPSKPSLA